MVNRRSKTEEIYDVVVVGAGHAGCEAALAAARHGSYVLVLTPNLDRIGFMPCNPSIGGPAKGHIVAEIDALGGEMGKAIDRTALQIRKLNASKGPAVQALRAQADKVLYSMAMKEALESQERLTLRQESARDVRIELESGRRHVTAVTTEFGNAILCKSVVITAGTFLRGSMIAGEWIADGARSGDAASNSLAASIGDVGIRLRRLKTGTPPRIDARTIDFSKAEQQDGSEIPLWFSYEGRRGEIQRLELPALASYPGQTTGWRNQLACYLVHTNMETHEFIRANAHRSPMYNGVIQGIGPRYCPSIEDKVMRFQEKTSHGLFLEPEGWRTQEIYVQGANTSLPADIQLASLRTIPALTNAHITRYGYAVEYDAVDPTELTPWFGSKKVEGLYLAGQVNGTSGYEEAAGQGLLAGLNASRHAGGLDPVSLRRDQAYIGVMADDLSTMEFVEPYRMLTSRAEHRLVLRADNAEHRLSDFAFQNELISMERYNNIQDRRRAIDEITIDLNTVYLSPNQRTAELLDTVGLPEPARSQTALEYLRRPEVSFSALYPALVELHPDMFQAGRQFDSGIASSIEIEAKYHAYIEKELRNIDRIQAMEDTSIGADVDYWNMPGLRNEACEKLDEIRPVTIGQASRIAGVTPGDLAVLSVYVRRRKGRMQDEIAMSTGKSH